MRFLLLVLSLTFTASASIIIPPGSFSNVAGNSSVSTTVAGNNNYPGGNSPNTILINETALAAQTAMGVTFNVMDGSDSTEYAVIKTVLNNTGETWTTFAMALSYVFLSGPITQANLLVVQLDSDSQPTISGNGTAGQVLLSSNTSQAVWTGLNVQNGDSITINFSIDTCPSCNGVWQLLQVATPDRQTPQVPEPGMFALVGLGLISVALRNKFRS